MPLYDLGLSSEKIHVIIDIGTYHTKIGFAGESHPRHILPSHNVKNDNNIVNICDPSLSKHELYNELFTFLYAIYFRHLLTNPKDRKVVICENFLQTELFRETLADVLFKQFSVVGILMTPALPLALIPLGTPTGLILNIGYQETNVICVFEGMVIIQSYKCVELGVHAHLQAIQMMLAELGTVRVSGEVRKSSEIYGELDLAVLEDIKARCCFSGTRPSQLDDPDYVESGMRTEHRAQDMRYPMKDGQHLTVSGKIRERSIEVLYDGDGDDNSIATLVLDSLLKSPIDCRKVLAEKILVIGGGCMMPGFTHRLKQELLALLKTSRYSGALPVGGFKFYKPNYNPNTMSWVGGAIMGSVEYLQDRYISRDFYSSKGALALPNLFSLGPVLKDTYQTASPAGRRTRDYLSSASAVPLSGLVLS